MSLNWREAILSTDASIGDAIRTIEQESLKIALVVNESEELAGVVTDGDIRRGLLRKLDLEDSVVEVMNSAPTLCNPSDSEEKIKRLLEEKVLLHMPIVDNGKVVDLITWDQLHSRKRFDNPIVLMAGGMGTRLRPLTENTPKPLLKVGQKPLLETILERFIRHGFTNFFISVHYLPEQVIEYFGDGDRWGVNITYLHETKPLGTAGALGLLPQGAVTDLPIIMMNGDVLTRVDFQQLLSFHTEEGASATMCSRQYAFQVPYGVIDVDAGRISQIVEKPVHRFFVNAGIYVLDPDVVRGVEPDKFLDMPELLSGLLDSADGVSMFPIHEYWLDIGQKKDFDQAQIDYSTDFE